MTRTDQFSFFDKLDHFSSKQQFVCYFINKTGKDQPHLCYCKLDRFLNKQKPVLGPFKNKTRTDKCSCLDKLDRFLSKQQFVFIEKP